MIKVIFTEESIERIKGDFIVSAFLRSEDTSNLHFITSPDGSAPDTLSIGLLDWVDGEQGEEEALRQGIGQVIAVALAGKCKRLIIDTKSFEDFFQEYSYPINTILEVMDGCMENAEEKTFKLLSEITLVISYSDSNKRKLSILKGKGALNRKLFIPVIVAPKVDRYSNRDTRFMKVSSLSYLSDSDQGDLEEFYDYMNKEGKEKTFREYLLEVINDKNITKFSTVYKASGISKYTFSKLLNFKLNPPHQPSRETVAALCVGLKLNILEAEKLYKAAGYSLGFHFVVDKVLRYSISNTIYDIDTVNLLLSYLEYPPLGEKPRQVEKEER